MHTDPKSEAGLCRVCDFEDEMTRDRPPIVWQVDWVLVIASHCLQVVSSAIASCELSWCNQSRFAVFGKILKSLPSQIVVFVQGKLSSI